METFIDRCKQRRAVAINRYTGWPPKIAPFLLYVLTSSFDAKTAGCDSYTSGNN